MRKVFAIAAVGCGAVLLGGCASNPPAEKPRTTKTQPSTSQPKPKPAGQPEIRTSAPAGGAVPLATGPGKNPTSQAGRGEPSLDDVERPAAWIMVDNKPGKFVDRDGHRQLQWVIPQPVRPAPTFRVEVFEPLLGKPDDLKYLLKTVESPDGSELAYAVSAYDGAFVAGKEYNLLNPGEGFNIRNWSSGDAVLEIAPLPPGTYLLAGRVANTKTRKEAAAVTYFTVGDGQ